MAIILHPEAHLLPYLRGELEGERRTRVARHLEKCARCRERAASFADALRELHHRVEQVPAPDWAVYRAQLRHKLSVRARPRSRRWWGGRFDWAALAVAGAACAAALLVVVLHQTPQLAAPPPAQLAVAAEMSGADIRLLRDYPIIEHLDLLENYDVIEHLDELTPPTTNATQS